MTSRIAIERQEFATWYTPDAKLPPKGEEVVLTISGTYCGRDFDRVFRLGRLDSAGDWIIEGITPGREESVRVDAWSDLRPYGRWSHEEADQR